MCVRKSIIKFSLLAKKKTVKIRNVFIAFIATNKPQTYTEILQSLNRKE